VISNSFKSAPKDLNPYIWRPTGLFFFLVEKKGKKKLKRRKKDICENYHEPCSYFVINHIDENYFFCYCNKRVIIIEK
jgi:hypothetical protein